MKKNSTLQNYKNEVYIMKNINLYQIFKTYSYSDLKKLFENAKTKDEQDFYMKLANLVLQKEQLRVISE